MKVFENSTSVLLFLVVLSLLFLFNSFIAKAQSSFVPLHDQSYHQFDRLDVLFATNKDSLLVFTSIKPYNRAKLALCTELLNQSTTAIDSSNHKQLLNNNSEWVNSRFLTKNNKKRFKKLYTNPADFWQLNLGNDFNLRINPIIYFQVGSSSSNRQFRYVNTRGVSIRGTISNKLGFYATLKENQASYADYVNQYVRRTQALPFEGRFKDFASSVGYDLFAPGYDFFRTEGYISFSPIKYINIQFGQDKNFIGNGFRSLLLSDVSNNYLFLKINTQVWKFNYQNLFMQLTGQFDRGVDQLKPKKFATMHFLSLQANRWLNVGFFEAVVFSRPNDGFELTYLNPLIFYRSVEFNLGSPDNVILGLDIKANIAKRFMAYGQLVLDELRVGELFSNSGWWGNKYGYQLGVKYFNVLGINQLDAQLEYNMVRPFTYTHNTTEANYTHYNMPLAHPLGANFRELVGVLRYQPHPQLMLTNHSMFTQQGGDIDTLNYGSNIFLLNTTRVSDFNNMVAQGNGINVFLNEFELAYQFKPNLFFDLTYTYRNEQSELNSSVSEHYFTLAMRLNLHRKKQLF